MSYEYDLLRLIQISTLLADSKAIVRNMGRISTGEEPITASGMNMNSGCSLERGMAAEARAGNDDSRPCMTIRGEHPMTCRPTRMWLSRTPLLGALALLALCNGLALAADPPAGELEEITVTAQKRSESEQNVPMSITTFGAVALQQKDINNFFDYATKVPNLAFAPTGDGVGTARTISIRGVSGNNVTSFYIDDTPLPDSIDPRVLDLDHIEMLRGPQGTLYGARSMGGLVRTVTKEPDLNDFSMTVHGGIPIPTRTDKPNYVGRRRRQHPADPRCRGAAHERLRRLRGGLFQAQLLHRIPRRRWPAPARRSPATGITTVEQCRRDRHLGLHRGLTIKPTDSLTITPKHHAAAGRLQRLSDGGLPHGYRQRHRLSGADAGHRRAHADQDGSEQLHPGALVQCAGRRIGRLGLVLDRRALEDRRWRAGVLELVFLPQSGRDRG